MEGPLEIQMVGAPDPQHKMSTKSPDSKVFQQSVFKNNANLKSDIFFQIFFGYSWYWICFGDQM